MQCQRPCIPRLPPSGPQRIYKWPSLDPYPILLNAFQAHSTLLHPTQPQSLQLNPIHSQPTLLTPTRSYPVPLSPTQSSNILINPAQPCPSLPHTTLSCPILFSPTNPMQPDPTLLNPTHSYPYNSKGLDAPRTWASRLRACISISMYMHTETIQKTSMATELRTWLWSHRNKVCSQYYRHCMYIHMECIYT